MQTTHTTADRSARQVAGAWWWFLVTGVLWLLIAITVLRFDLTSVAAVGALLGAVLLLAGVNEFLTMSMRGSSGLRWLHAAMGVVFVLGGIWAFVHPIGAFYELASILGFVLVLKGGLDIALSVAMKDQNDVWGLGLAVGVLEVLLGFWVSQQFFAPRAILIVTWVGFAALFRGIGEIVLAFQLRRVARTPEL
jgi:uncharacterized membrane protein HdeD (DUF308 family)